MLKNSSLNAAFPLADSLAEHGMQVEAIAGTPLELLVNACATLDSLGVTYEGVEGPIAETSLLEASVAKDLTGECRHDNAMQELVDAASKTILQSIHFARNIVNPMVETVVREATQLADDATRSDYLPLSIEPFQHASILSSPLLADMVSKYAINPMEKIDLTLPMPKMTPDQIRHAAATGNPRFDEEVAAFTNAMSDDEVESVYDQVFGNGRMPSARTTSDFTSSRAENGSRMLLAFLLANRFFNDVPEGVNMELGRYQAYMSSVMSQTGRAVSNVMRNRNDNARMKQLVMAGPTGPGNYSVTGTFKVNQDVYQQYLKDGGTPEALFGAANSGKKGYDYQDLIDNKDKYAAVWRRTFELLRNSNESKRFTVFLDALRQAMQTQIREIPEEARITDDGTYQQRLTKELLNIKGGGIKDPWKMTRKLVCRVFFAHTDAERILAAIDAEKKNHPDMDVREAATIAIIETVSKWVAAQFKVTSALGMVRG